MASEEAQALILYYLESKYYNHARKYCNDEIRKGKFDVLYLWKAVAMAYQGELPQAIKWMKKVQKKRSFELPAVVARIFAQKLMPKIDQDQIKDLERSIRSMEDNADVHSLRCAVKLCCLFRNLSLGRRLGKRLLSLPGGEFSRPMLGWLEIARQDFKPATMQTALQHFDSALDGKRASERPLDALLGKCLVYRMQKKMSKALEIVDECIVIHDWYHPALTLKAKILMVMGDWSQSLDLASRALEARKNRDIDGLILTVLFYLVRAGNAAEAVKYVRLLGEVIKKTEPMNRALFFRCAQCIGRLCGRNKEILGVTLKMAQLAADRLASDQTSGHEVLELSKYLVEYGQQSMLAGDVDSAEKAFKEAMALDASNLEALQGTMHVFILKGQISEAQDHMEFMLMSAESVGVSAELIYLQAMIAWRGEKDLDKHIDLLVACKDKQIELLNASRHRKNTFDWFTSFNPHLLLEVCTELLQHCGVSPLMPSESLPRALKEAMSLLQFIAGQISGSLQTKLLLAKCQFISRGYDNAVETLEDCLKLDQNYAGAHLLYARLYIHKNQFSMASRALDNAVAADFATRDTVVFHLAKAKLLSAKAEFMKAKDILEAALDLDGVRTESLDVRVELEDRSSVFIQLAELYTELQSPEEAIAIIKQAEKTFKGTSEEVRILIARSKLSATKGDVMSSIALLKRVPPSSPSFIKARMVMADLYLNNKKDRAMYIKCYSKIVQMDPNSKASYIVLGDAYMQIQEPDKAIAAYESALNLDQDDVELATMIGKALVSTHDFTSAVEYYTVATKGSPNNIALHIDLAELYIKLGIWGRARRTIEQALEQIEDPADDKVSVKRIVDQVKLLTQLADVCFGLKDEPQAIEQLQRARLLQNQVCEQLKHSPDELRKQKKVATDIRYRLGNYFYSQNNKKSCIEQLVEGLTFDGTHQNTLELLSKCYLETNDMKSCQKHCETLLAVDPGNRVASLMLADILYHTNNIDAATYHFKQLLLKKPDNFAVLSRMITLLWRGGNLDEAKLFLQRAKRISPRVAHSAGYNYCKGLYFAHALKSAEAITYLNKARRSGEWGRLAIERMVLVYLSPSGTPMWEEREPRPDAAEAIQVIEDFKKEASIKPSTLYHEILWLYADLLTRQKAKIDNVIRSCVRIYESNKNYVPALLCMATALFLNKQGPKARNQLKRIAKTPYMREYAREFEEAYLFLGSIYIESKKYDLALKMCKMCIKYNKACGKAWENMGHIMENEQSYKDAAEFYENAWKYDSETTAAVGYKLAFNYLKAKEYIKTIDVCHKVLAMYPHYPRIRKDILEKAYQLLRT